MCFDRPQAFEVISCFLASHLKFTLQFRVWSDFDTFATYACVSKKKQIETSKGIVVAVLLEKDSVFP